MTDADLVRGARGGSAEAWQVLYGRYLPTVWRQAYALVQDQHVAEDLTSETMLAFLQSLPQMDGDAPRIGGWLRTVVRCKAADHHRKMYRARNKLPRVADHLNDLVDRTDAAGPAELAETRARVTSVLELLSERQRLVLEWKYLDRLSVREIASRLGETVKAVETFLYRTRREFRRLFKAAEKEIHPAIGHPGPATIAPDADVPHES